MGFVTTAVVLTGGPNPPIAVALPDDATVIAADDGAELAALLGVEVDLLIGDLDSVSPGTQARARRIDRHPTDKDATDLELALGAALRLGPDRILVVGGAGGRFDHLFGNALVLAAAPYAAVQVDARFGAAAVHVIRTERRLLGEPGELISLFAVHGPATAVVTDGLAYPLRGETLEPGSSRGVSNVFETPHVRIAIGHGVLLAIRPNCSEAAGS